ncbi:hypothetical protein Hypma_015055 [Hypsizygus marmoreus]|uniref:Ribosomal protein s17 n=1 Tax=Hypsizygus marmoreus TaxID=39966 RepID=A0A369K4W0_HYPMA|nr:hypothetical protein Hypma_015055 [Hypsizygus marmoreus]
MKFSASLSLCVLLPLLSQATAISVPNLNARQNDNQRNRGGNNNNNNNNNNAGNNNNNTGNNAGGNAGAGAGGDPQKSLTLDPKVIATGFANDGQDVPTAGQVASLTSTNNFINFCLTVGNLPITNGKQITTGSCNPAPIGAIPSVDKMPSSKFTNPKNGGTVAPDTAFTISMAIKNLQTGNFVNAQANYFSAPQQLSGGTIVGHSHVVVEQLTALDQTTPTDPKKFAFFKGLNAAAAGGVLTADVTNGLPAGAYRLCSINAAANHQPVIVPVAQHGSLDDCVYFTSGAAAGNNNNNGAAAGGNGNAGNNNNNNAGNAAGNNNAGNAAGNNNAGNANNGNAAASATTTAAATATPATGNTGAGGGRGGGRGGQGQGQGQGQGRGGGFGGRNRRWISRA